MKAPLLKVEELKEWLERTAVQYASFTNNGKKTRLMVSLDGTFYVTVAGEEVFKGTSMEEAVQAYNKIIEQ